MHHSQTKPNIALPLDHKSHPPNHNRAYTVSPQTLTCVPRGTSSKPPTFPYERWHCRVTLDGYPAKSHHTLKDAANLSLAK